MKIGQKLRKLRITMLLLVFQVLPAFAQNRPVEVVPPTDSDIYILMGQSNMSGVGSLADLPPNFPKHQSQIYLFSNAWAWQRAQEPVDSSINQKDTISLDPNDGVGVGPGLAFADSFVALRPDRKITIVPCAKGGTSMKEWARSENEDTLYGNCLRRMREVAKHGRIKGVLWYQGESDAKQPIDNALHWPGRFTQLVADLRNDTGNPSLPIVFAQLARFIPDQKPWGRPAEYLKFWNDIRVVQANIQIDGVKMVHADPFDYVLADGTHVVHPDGFNMMMPDGLHITTAAQLLLGEEFAKAFLELEAEH